MIHLDKLVLAFKTQLYYPTHSINQFEKIEEKLESEHYNFGSTQLEQLDLSDIKTQFQHNYKVVTNGREIAYLQWGSNGTTKYFGYMTLLNYTFYNGEWILYKQAIEDLDLTINNISRLDIAYDSTIDPTQRYFNIIKNTNNQIVINGNKVTDRKKLLKSPYFICYGSLDNPLEHPQIHFATKDKSLTCRTYNKSEEIERSKKTYISDLFSKENSTNNAIFRLEISLNSKALGKMLRATHIPKIEDKGEAHNILVRHKIENMITQGEGVKAMDKLSDMLISGIDCNVKLDSGWDFILKIFIQEKVNKHQSEEVMKFLERLEDSTFLLGLHRNSMLRLFRYSTKTQTRKTLI